MSNAHNWRFGNATVDGADRRGWLVGPFIDPGDLRMSKDVEIKWGIHAAGEERNSWHDQEYRTTVILLISGRFRINLSVGSHQLSQQGDYAMWGPGIGHSWHAEEDSVVLTIRWPAVL
jgi:hypothetical protein